MSDNNISYYAVIPATVRYDKSIPANAKLLYAEVTALCNKEGFCWADNAYFADLYDASVRSVQRWISALVDTGYLLCNIQYHEDGKTVLRRCLSVNVTTSRQNCQGGHDKIVTENNTRINNMTDRLTDIIDEDLTKKNKERYNALVRAKDSEAVLEKNLAAYDSFIEQTEYCIEDGPIGIDWTTYRDLLAALVSIVKEIAKREIYIIGDEPVIASEVIGTFERGISSGNDDLLVKTLRKISESAADGNITNRHNYIVAALYNLIRQGGAV